MGRPKSVHKNLPPRMTARPSKYGLRYYYTTPEGGKIPLGCSEIEATHRWAAIESGFQTLPQDELLERRALLKRAISATPASGVYFLISDGDIRYVGQTKNLFKRLEEHRLRGRIFDSYAFLPCAVADMRMLESRYIEALKPKWNREILGTTLGTEESLVSLTS